MVQGNTGAAPTPGARDVFWGCGVRACADRVAATLSHPFPSGWRLRQPPAVGSGEGRERLYFNAPLWVGDLEKQLAEQECEVQPPPLRAALPCRRARGDLNKALGEAAGGCPSAEPPPRDTGAPKGHVHGSPEGTGGGCQQQSPVVAGTWGTPVVPGPSIGVASSDGAWFSGRCWQRCREALPRVGGSEGRQSSVLSSSQRGLSDIISIIQSSQACALCRLQAETQPGYSQPKAASFGAAAPSQAEATAIN